MRGSLRFRTCVTAVGKTGPGLCPIGAKIKKMREAGLCPDPPGAKPLDLFLRNSQAPPIDMPVLSQKCHNPQTVFARLWNMTASTSCAPLPCHPKISRHSSPRNGQERVLGCYFLTTQDNTSDISSVRTRTRKSATESPLTSPAFQAGNAFGFSCEQSIPRSGDNPELCWVDDTKIVGYLIAVCGPVPWHVIAEEIEHRGAEFPERGVTFIVCVVPVHQAP